MFVAMCSPARHPEAAYQAVSEKRRDYHREDEMGAPCTAHGFPLCCLSYSCAQPIPAFDAHFLNNTDNKQYGHSSVVNPLGDVIAEADEKEAIVYADIGM
jgi:predicted amidohydrolase